MTPDIQIPTRMRFSATFIFLILSVAFWVISGCSGPADKKDSGSFLVFKVKYKDQSGVPVDLIFPDRSFFYETDSTGASVYSIQVEKSDLVRLIFDEDDFFIFGGPGDSLILKDSRHQLFSNPVFEGDRATENNFIILKNRLENELDDEAYLALFQSDEKDFIQKLEQMHLQHISYVQDFQKQNGVFSPEFADFINIDLRYFIVNMKMEYRDIHRYLTKNDSFEVSDTYYSFFQNLNTDNNEKQSIANYRKFLVKYLNFKAEEITDSTEIYLRSATANAGFKGVEQFFREQKIRNYLFNKVMEDLLENSYNDAAKLYPQFLQKQKDEKLKLKIQSEFEAIRSLLPGNPMPEMLLKSADGKTLNISDFKGKVVYMDIWATWCGPCIREMPFLEALVQKYRSDDDVVILSISVDEDEAAWRSFLKSKQGTSSLQLFEPENLNAEWVNYFRINSIPRFILVDKNGMIADATAPAPSAREITHIISGLR
jgi:thiol-disulfide isomerase/thioredoxin